MCDVWDDKGLLGQLPILKLNFILAVIQCQNTFRKFRVFSRQRKLFNCDFWFRIII